MWLNLTERQLISKWSMSLTVSDLISGAFNQETITIILLVVPLGFSTGTELLKTSAHKSHTDFPMVNLDPPDSARGRKRGKLLKSRTLSKIVKGTRRTEMQENYSSADKSTLKGSGEPQWVNFFTAIIPLALLGLAFTSGDAPWQRSVLFSRQSISKGNSEVWHWWTIRSGSSPAFIPEVLDVLDIIGGQSHFFLHSTGRRVNFSFSYTALCTGVTFSQRKMAMAELALNCSNTNTGSRVHDILLLGGGRKKIFPYKPKAWKVKAGENIFDRVQHAHLCVEYTLQQWSNEQLMC